ncbi:MAG: holin [Bacillaceae bacterium]|jgi:toxin secretion/phage lysis holin|uniref:phage holin family protein n=1 Tax=Aeribacillus sp. FSL K6-2848 TaxID=2954612 RepID=UPI000E3B3426|nr:MAG: holin [Bacillaceae bacterium]
MDHIFKTVVSIGGALASYLFGGWSALLTVLLTFVVFDYMSGVVAAYLEKKLNSGVGVKGIAKKVAIFLVVAIANMVDIALGGEVHMFRDATIWFYLANELLSIIENLGKIGVPIPEKLRNAVQVLQGKGEEK